MPELISKITSLVTSATSGLTVLFIAVAVAALVLLCIALAATHNDSKRAGYVRSIGTVLVIAVVCAGASGLVAWAMA